MAAEKKDKKTEVEKEANADFLWRKPITLDSLDDEDPLAALYRGREVEGKGENAEDSSEKPKQNTASTFDKKTRISKQSDTDTKQKKSAVRKTSKTPKIVNKIADEKSKDATSSPKVTEEELKNLLKIKSDSFQFTDIREILRGKSFDIYAYLRVLSKEAGVCKIKHLDLMQILDISRPTLFKQGDWLTRLSLIEKRNVPGDHLGTSYTVHRLEDVLPISETLARQMQSQIEKFKQEID
ncbi:MAG: hypothetical protein ABI891_00995 [Acidobacteriota bacterium]